MQGASLLYFGEQVDEFVRLCEPFGTCWLPAIIDPAESDGSVTVT